MDVIATLAPTGGVGTRTDSPHLPLTAAEVARDVAAATALGITTVHVHVRDADGRPDWHRDAYAETVGRIRDVAPDVVISISTSGRSVSEFERRADCLALDGDLKPDLASLTLSSLNFAQQASINEPETVRALAPVFHDVG